VPTGAKLLKVSVWGSSFGGFPLLLTRRFGKELAFGQNLIPDAGGLIRVGDPVEILDAALPAEPYRFSRDTIAERSAAAGSSGSPIERQPMCLSGRTSSAPSSATSRIRAQS
jgi:hypothetical protein